MSAQEEAAARLDAAATAVYPRSAVLAARLRWTAEWLRTSPHGVDLAPAVLAALSGEEAS